MRKFVRSLAVAAVGISALFVGKSASAFGVASPALWATYPNYSGKPDGAASAGRFCVNRSILMPSNRNYDCSVDAIVRESAGKYKIRVRNGAPLPILGSPSLHNDSGYAVFVTTVGGKNHCSESKFELASDDTRDIISSVQCVDVNGNNADTAFSWTYRTDSSNYSQLLSLDEVTPLPHARNVIYGRVNRGSSASFSSSQSFNALGEVMSVSRVSTGRHQLTFNNVSVISGDIEFVTTGMNNVIVQRTCADDTSSACKRAVCIPYSWTPGAGAPGTNIPLEVRCYSSSGSAVDVDFRVLIANETHTSQATVLWDGVGGSGVHYLWLNSPTYGSNNCFFNTQFKHRNQHESPFDNFPTLSAQTCRTGTGTYRTTMSNPQQLYHRDGVSALVSSRATGGTYCNMERIDCANAQCNSTPSPFFDVKCYTRTGTPVDAPWNGSITY